MRRGVIEPDSLKREVEAAAWRARLDDLKLEGSEAFEAWLGAHPGNVEAWAAVNGPWVAVGDLATAPEMMTARRDALDRARRDSRRRWRDASWPPAAVAAGLALVLVFVGALAIAWPRDRAYETALGERRVVTLADGSRLSLDADTAVRVRYSRDARKLELVRGQARFDVAHDIQRPFSVKAREQTVVATGTAFNIDLLGRTVRVTLIEGRVTVLKPRAGANLDRRQDRSGATRSDAVKLIAGEQLVTPEAGPPRVEVASVDRVTAWQSGQLVFEDETLANVAARVSRYTRRNVSVDPSAAGLRVSGVFNVGDVATFVDTVTRYLPVRAEEVEDGVVLRRR